MTSPIGTTIKQAPSNMSMSASAIEPVSSNNVCPGRQTRNNAFGRLLKVFSYNHNNNNLSPRSNRLTKWVRNTFTATLSLTTGIRNRGASSAKPNPKLQDVSSEYPDVFRRPEENILNQTFLPDEVNSKDEVNSEILDSPKTDNKPKEPEKYIQVFSQSNKTWVSIPKPDIDMEGYFLAYQAYIMNDEELVLLFLEACKENAEIFETEYNKDISAYAAVLRKEAYTEFMEHVSKKQYNKVD